MAGEPNLSMQRYYRHELKFIIDVVQYYELRNIFRALMTPDSHAGNDGEYTIRSLYLDDIYRSAYQEKMDGVQTRKKYRIRTYNCDERVIALECKFKRDAYVRKESILLKRDEWEQVLKEEYGFLLKKKDAMAQEFFVDARTNLIRPWGIVEYDREAYVDKVGTTRITFDKHLRVISEKEGMFRKDALGYLVMEPNLLILEVKYTEILPVKIAQMLRKYSLTAISASKYCMCVDKLEKNTYR